MLTREQYIALKELRDSILWEQKWRVIKNDRIRRSN